MEDALKQSVELESEATSGMKCLWMLAGVVGYKLCDREYDCDNCPFDSAIHDGSHAQAEPAPRPSSAQSSIQSLKSPNRTREPGLTVVEGYEIAGTRFYHPSHTWARIEDEGRVRIGLDDFGQKLAGRIYSLYLPATGTSADQNQSCWRVTHQAGEVELAAPVSGIVVEVNARLREQPSLINRDPYGEGWAMMIEPVRLEECLKQLLYGHKVAAWYERETEALYQRLNQLLTDAHTTVGATMQDGGARIKDFTCLLAANEMRQLIDSFLIVPVEREVILWSRFL